MLLNWINSKKYYLFNLNIMRIFILSVNYFMLIFWLIGYITLFFNEKFNWMLSGLIIGIITLLIFTVPSIIYAHMTKMIDKEKIDLKIKVLELEKEELKRKLLELEKTL